MTNQQTLIIPNALPIVGSRWFRCDFHVHGRGSTDYGNNTDTPDMWLRAAIAAGLDCVAITDHNSGDWIDDLKAALQRLRDDEGVQLVLFPGVEVTVEGGCHLLVIFDPARDRDHVKSFLAAAGLRNDKQGQIEAQSKSIQTAFEAAHAHEGLCILAHANDARGLLLDDSGPHKQHIVCDPRLHGIELKKAEECSRYKAVFASGSPTEMAEAQAQNRAYLNAFEQFAHDRTAGLGEVCFSDNPDFGGHGLNGIAKNSTWIKMSNPDKEGLRLALHDGAMCCQIHDDAHPNRNNFDHPIVESITISHAYVAGLREPLVVNFSPWLSTIVGGFGSGKSTIIESLRIALQRGVDLQGLGSRSTVASSFADFNKIFNKVDGTGALRPETKISAVYRKEDHRFEISWEQSSAQATIRAIKPDGSFEPEPGDIAQRFPISIYSQKHIYEVARNPSAMLDIIDQSQEVNRADWRHRWDEVVLKFMAARAYIRELCSRQNDVSTLQGRLNDLNDRIGLYEKEGNQQTREAWQSGSQQSAELNTIYKALQQVTQSIKTISSFNELPSMTHDLWNKDKPSDAIGKAYGRAANRMRDEVVTLINQASALSGDIVEEFRVTVAGSEWKARHQEVDKAHTEMLAGLKDQGVGDPLHYATLLKERDLQMAELQLRQNEKISLTTLEAEARRLRGEMLILRRELTSKRQAFVSTLAQHLVTVKLEIEPFGDALSWEEGLRTQLSVQPNQFESTLTPDPAHLEDGNDKCRPANLVEDVYRPDSNAAARQAKIIDIQNKMQNIHSGSTVGIYNGHFENKVQSHQPEVIDRILFLYPDDRVIISYRADKYSHWQPISVGSAGQKTAAILTFLLAYGTEPLIIDQPEDDLDNKLVYKLVVEQIKENKQRRQLIIVTHNPNIPVNGDAELIVVMAPIPGGFAEFLAGGLQEPEVRQQICEIMEGGEDAFKKRFDRIIGGKA